jgi:N-carbamoylputrescine amidase
MKVLAAALQMPSEPLAVDANLERADALLADAHSRGAALAVLPEMFNTGYGLLDDFAACAEGPDGPTFRHLAQRSRAWGMTIAAGFVEREGHHLYDSLGLVTPDGRLQVYRKRNLVFWERFRFRPGRAPVVAETPLGRIGLAVCADMIYRRIWDDYRDRIDLAVVAAAWPDFACQRRGRRHWLFGQLGPMSAEIPALVSRDLGVPVVFANQCGETRTTIPLLGMWVTERLCDRFAGHSSVVDGRHGVCTVAGDAEEVLYSPITLHSRRGPKTCRSTFPSVRAESSSGLARP